MMLLPLPPTEPVLGLLDDIAYGPLIRLKRTRLLAADVEFGGRPEAAMVEQMSGNLHALRGFVRNEGCSTVAEHVEGEAPSGMAVHAFHHATRHIVAAHEFSGPCRKQVSHVGGARC